MNSEWRMANSEKCALLRRAAISKARAQPSRDSQGAGSGSRDRAIAWVCNATIALAGCALLVAGCAENEPPRGAPGGPAGMKMLVLGMDGVDHALLSRLMDAGRLPNFRRLADRGSFLPLGTSMPPQSPVAWSNVISGADPGVHEIYDFIHRDPNPPDPEQAVRMYLSTADVRPSNGWLSRLMPDAIPLDKEHQIPLKGSEHVSLREGPSFWDSLLERGVTTTIYRMPANFPVTVKRRGSLWASVPSNFRCLCGMGTPDILGGYGEFTLFTEDLDDVEKLVGGGKLVRLDFDADHAQADLTGPLNPFHKPIPGIGQRSFAGKLLIVRDPTAPTATLQIGSRKIVLSQGEWSDWLPFELESGLSSGFALLGVPTTLPTMSRFYLRSVRPHFELYMSPMNVDPLSPAAEVSSPGSFAAEIARSNGRYYTTGIPEDTKALRADALNEDEFLSMVGVLAAERTKQYHEALAKFDRGFLFFYFGHTDQLAHVFWRDIDPGHPGRIASQEGKYDKVIENTYLEMDERVGEALAALDDDDVLIVMSDHGFSSFRRGFNLNRWLEQEGYLADNFSGANDNLEFVDWDNTRAYACGINSLYINLAGREKHGIVPAEERDALRREIARKLVQVRDDDGSVVIEKVYITDEIYPGADPRIAPDLLVGYAANYRASWPTATGGTSQRLIRDNRERWSGDHCIAAYLVPGILVTNRKVHAPTPTLIDIAPTILGRFGAAKPAEMTGRDLFDPASASVPSNDRGVIKE